MKVLSNLNFDGKFIREIDPWIYIHMSGGIITSKGIRAVKPDALWDADTRLSKFLLWLLVIDLSRLAVLGYSGDVS